MDRQAKNIPEFDRIPVRSTAYTPAKRTNRRWLNAHKAFLRWKKTPDFAKWKHRQFLKQGGTCYYCHEPLQGTRVNVEHIIPKSKGGDNSKANLVLACHGCNKAKGASILPEAKRQELKTINRKKKGTYHQLREQYMSEEELAYSLREMFRED